MALKNYASLNIAILLCLVLLSCSYREITIKNAILGFHSDNPNNVSLGKFMVVHSHHVDIVLSFKESAIPELIAALKSNDPLIVAQSAYCLECLKARLATQEVQKAWDKFNGIHETRTAAQQYALERTEVFLTAAKENFPYDLH